LVVRTDGNLATLSGAIRGEVLGIDKEQPLSRVRPLEQVVSESVARERFLMLLLGIFAAVALTLAAVGLYGVISYSVTQRTHEIGIRAALGAQRKDVLKLIVGQGMMLALVGVGIGMVLAFALTRLMATLLFGITATDAFTFIAIPAVLTGVALVSCFVPARRATKVDPIIALRYE
jgi:putative ABC transport system permease protein